MKLMFMSQILFLNLVLSFGVFISKYPDSDAFHTLSCDFYLDLPGPLTLLSFLSSTYCQSTSICLADWVDFCILKVM